MRPIARAVAVLLASLSWSVPLSAREDSAASDGTDRASRLSSVRGPRPSLRSDGPGESLRRRITPDERAPRVELDGEGQPIRPRAAEAAAAVPCDTNQYAVLSGSALFQYIQDAGPDCANQMFAGNATTFAAFTKTKVLSVANATAGRAASYNGTDPGNGLEALYLWIRAGFYVAYYNSAQLPWYSPSTGKFDAQVTAAARGSIDALVGSGHFYDNSDANGQVIGEAIILMDSSESQAYYLPVVKEWLNRWSQSYATSWYMRSGVNGIFTVLFRGHQQADFRAAVASDSVLVSRLSAFVDKTWMLGSDAEYMIVNATGELTRFLQYPSAAIYPAVKAKTQAILQQYSLLEPLYLKAAMNVSYYDDCAAFGVCGYEQQVEAQVLTRSYTCSATYQMRAQALTTGQFMESCPKLTAQEAYFHQKLSTGSQPVAADLNTDLEVVVFDSSDDYQLYAAVIFGIDTNNGGMYLEGNPAQAGNQARFICYRAEWMPQFEIWNLTHETVHYLDGRFDMKGGFGDYNTGSGKTVWWIEGLAEYVSKKNYNDASVSAARTKAYTLSTIFSNDYYSGQTRVYTWGYLAVRFMFERHPADVSTILAYFRPGNYAGYLTWLNARLSTYNAEFSSWCDTVQSVPDGDTTAPTASLTAPANGATLSGQVTLSATASDNVGVSRVEFLVDGAVVASDTSSPYSVSWNSASVSNGARSLRARAVDAAGNAGLSATVSVTVNNTSGPVALTNGVAVSASGAQGSQAQYYIDVPAGATNLVIATSGGTGDLDLYTRFGTPPTLTTYDCRPYTSGNAETCTVAAPRSGRTYVLLHGYAAYSGASLKASFTPASGSAPSITTQPVSRTVAVGQTATFSVVAGGTAPLSYQWYKNGTAVSGATSASYTTPVATAADNGASFYVRVSNAYGSVNSSTATLTVTGGTTTTVRVLSPNGGETWTRGSTRTISWTTTNSQHVDVALYKGATFVQWVTWHVVSSTGSYSWAIPSSLSAGSDYKITILDYVQRTISDSSDAPFTIN